MKAWICSTDNSEGSSIVYADTSSQARLIAMGRDPCIDANYIDVRAVRCPDIDNMEDREPRDNYWLNDEIRLILVKKYDWACVEPEYSDCDNCSAKEYCHYFD